MCNLAGFRTLQFVVSLGFSLSAAGALGQELSSFRPPVARFYGMKKGWGEKELPSAPHPFISRGEPPYWGGC